MNQSYKPQGYPSVSVYIIAEEAQRVIDFLQAVFEARPARRRQGTGRQHLVDRHPGRLAHNPASRTPRKAGLCFI